MFSGLREDIRTIREKDPAARSALEVVLCYPGFHAIRWHRLAHRAWRARLYLLARVLSHVGRMLTGIEIHPGATIGRRVFIDHGMGVVIGETAEVGDDCTLYQGVTLGGTSLTRGTKRHPTLLSGVIVGSGAQVLGPFTVGQNARVGANAVVVREVAAGDTVVGIPARSVKETPRVVDPAPDFVAYGAADARDFECVDRELTRLREQIAGLDAQVRALAAASATGGGPTPDRLGDIRGGIGDAVDHEGALRRHGHG